MRLYVCWWNKRVIIESDYNTCIDSFSSTKDSIPWGLNHFVEAIYVACSSPESISFSWSYRETDMAAHKLAIKRLSFLFPCNLLYIE